MTAPVLNPETLSPRRKSVPVRIGHVTVGGGAPIVVQSMTNTDTADASGTAAQVAALARAGSELVRITVDREAAAQAVPRIRDELDRMGVDVPLVGDFHYIGHQLLTKYPACAEALAKYRINPGNVGFKAKRDKQFATMIETALEYDRPVRIGVNWGSLDQELLTELMDQNAKSSKPLPSQQVSTKPSYNRRSGAPRGPGRLVSARTRSFSPARYPPCRTSSPFTANWPGAATMPCISA